MKLSGAKAGALLIWINSVCPEEPVGQFTHLKDGHQLLRICYKLQGKVPDGELKTLSLYNKVEIIFSILHYDFHLTTRQSSLILQKIDQEVDLELQLAKVAILLCYCSFKKNNLQPLSANAQSVIASMFHLVKDDADGLSLDEGLDQFLTQDSVMNSSTSSTESSGCSSFYTDDESPIFGRFQRPPRVKFQELCKVAFSSDGSPVQDIMSTPHFQLKKLRKELAHEGDVRDELEIELANQIAIISEKEGLISQLQHRVERLLREQGELEKDHKAELLELQEKNESLLRRVHEVLKQCQDLKTDNSQKEKKIDELTEENGTLAAQVRNTFFQLARAEEEVAKLTLTHETSQAEWMKRKEFIERELNEVVTHRVCLNEQVQILQGKISVLEDELKKAQSQERGEVMGPIMEWEKLKQELSELTLKRAQLQDTISRLEKEKAEVEALLVQERCSFEKETTRLQTLVFDLEKSVSSIRMEREALQKALMTQKEMFTSQISALESDVSRLQQVEVRLTTEITISAELRQQRGELEGKVACLDKMVNALQTEIQGMEKERETKQDALNALMVDLQNAQTTLQDYEKKLEKHQKVVEDKASLTKEACTLRQEIDEHLQTIGELQGQISILRQEKTEEESKVSQALTKIESVKTQILELSEQISLKDEEITNLRNEYVSLDTKFKLVKEQNCEINESCKEHEDTIKKLQQELLSASSTASEKQEEVLVLSAEVASLKEQICHYNKNDQQKQDKLSVLEAEQNVLKENLTSIRNQLTEATTTTLQKESELISLKQELCLQETLREKSQELETARCEEFERKVNELQAKIIEVSTLASEREACMTSLQCEIKDQQLRAKQSEDDLRRELEEHVGNLQRQLEAANCGAADKDHQLESLEQKLRQMELLCQQKDKDVLVTLQTKEDLETKIVELAEKQHLDECQNNLEKERGHLSAEVSSLKEEICCYLENDQQKQQEVSLLKDEYYALKESFASLQNQLIELTTTASQKESELLLVQQEVCHQEALRESAQELETVMRKDFERKMSELQAKILEISTLASEREAQISSLQDEMKDQQLKSKQSEGDLRIELEEKVCTLKGELHAAICDAANKDHQLESLDQKLRLIELLCQQKDKDVLETHKAKEDLEKKIGELLVEKQQLHECQHNLEKERDHLLSKVSSLKEEISNSLLNEQQKRQEVSVLKDEQNALKENLAALQNQLEEMTATALQKESELILLQQELCLKEKAQDHENIIREESKKKVCELQAKILEVSTLASEREAQISSLHNEIKDQQLRSQQSEDDLRRELEKKVAILQGQLETVSRDVTDKDHLLQSLDQKLRQMELLCQQKDKDVLETQQAKEDLEKKIVELLVEKQQLHKCQHFLEKERDHLLSKVSSLKEEISSSLLNEQPKQQEVSLLKDEQNALKENLAALQNQLEEMTATALQKESELILLQQELCLKEKAQDHENIIREESKKKVCELQAKILEVSTLASEREAQISSLHNEIKDQQLRSQQSEDDLHSELEKKVAILQGQLETVSRDVTDKDHLLQSLDQKLRQMELLCQQKEKYILETHQEKEDLKRRIVELHADKHKLDGYQQNLEIMRKERDHLCSLSQSLQRECDASQRIRAELELKVEEQSGSILTLKNTARQWEEQNNELLEQLKIKSEAVEHCKTQVELARNHYNGKKQLLLEAQETNKTLEHSLESCKREVKALETELTLARMNLDQAKTKEKNLVAKLKSLEAQVDFTDRQLREQKKMTDKTGEVRVRDGMYARVPETRHDTSTDSLEFDLNDSLNAGSRSAVPGESSTPLVRSSERLAAKRRALGAESLETLYFTPMSQQGNKRKDDHNNAFERKLETSITSFGDLVVDSAKKLTASARRRRTTQVINITMAKTSGSVNGEESFSSVHSARSQPNLAIHHSRPVSLDLSEESARATLSKTDKLDSLPGYRRSAVHSVGPPRATSTFCIGAENEPEHAADDWMRIAELQARNKACLPHLKSSYPLESRPSLGLPSFTITDDDLRMGDPDETIRRASMIPGQLMESLNSRRLSLAPGASSSQALAQSQPQRSTMLPGQIRSSTAAYRASQVTKTTSNVHVSENARSPLAPKRPGSQLQGPDTPEAKKLASCFPRPMTPKGRHTNIQNRRPNSPAERRQSLMFTVVNTPKTNTRGDSRLQRGLNKLRNSARKSPAVASRALRSAMSAVDGRSPLDSTRRKSPRNKSPKSSNAKKIKFRIKV
ncbi:nuclear mitotic apparatus protein 1-like isoform X3 [Myxocyprinus asiaticus]|uniref:nuclear mitotic apparatus protein 1-like isoform X3 n=1 Tax=Myxocyprinus asiaticus TaxID=70543 RepID=UPI00222140AA|nr:nuclear mitotic apparatus protein 1-like isoform X3 [Myxocyprinus asiaticus]